ncbi:MAG: hypothetical protein KJP21_01260 [Bacteroidia bacterium]|nr:hypothetical protein [Bacteroidia bacterium]NNJ56743.1 hypothetical protein [Bacteroidia bacterium]
MRNLVALIGFVFLSFSVIAQNDSLDIVFGYPDSTKINVHIDSEDATKEPQHIVLLGIGTVGPFESNALAFHFKYANQMNSNLGFSTKWSNSIQDNATKHIHEIDAMSHISLWSKTKKSDMGLKLLDVKTETNKREYKQPYFASFPFEVRHQLKLDVGLSHLANRAELEFYALNTPDTTFIGSKFSSLNLVIGSSYTRVRNVNLTINKLAKNYYYSKFVVGVNVGYNLSNSGSFSRCFKDSACTSIESSNLPNVDLKKIGIGFDLNYTFSSANPKWIMAMDLQGRFSPFFEGESHRFDNGAYVFIQNNQYTSKLVLMPRFSVGYIL